MTRAYTRTVWTVLLTLSTAAAVAAAEVQLRSDCHTDKALVTLGDVADVRAADPQQAARLATVELLAAPPAGQTRTVDLPQLRQLLELRGIDLSRVRLSGASRVRVTSVQSSSPMPAVARPITESSLRQRNERVGQAVGDYLRRFVDAKARWQVAVRLTAGEAERVPQAGQMMVVEGGREPFTGLQQFVVAVRTADGTVQVPVRAEVTLPEQVVVAVRPIARGSVVRAGDVQLAPAPLGTRMEQVVFDAAEVIGKEATRALATDTPIETNSIRSPLLVRRRDVVTVFAYAGSLRISTNAVALQDGGQGDLVTVESMLGETRDRPKYVARVVGVQEVEVYARGRQLAPRTSETTLTP